MDKKIDIEKVKAFAEEKHKGQKYGKLDYFTGHILEVYKEMCKLNGKVEEETYETAIIVALLHDTIEDTDTTREELEKTFNKEVADAVSSLTRQKGESYLDYLLKVINFGGAALYVKYADLNVNIRTSVQELQSGQLQFDVKRMYKQRLEKYELARHIVVKAIKEYEHVDVEV